jgi:undecaprenyl diphosphate synthase
VVENLMWQCRDWGISVVTFWGFSTENWERSDTEVRFLMDLFTDLIKRNVSDLERNGVRFRHLGRRDRIPKRLRAVIEDAERRTRGCSDYYFNLCLDYGGRDEIVRAARRVMEEGLEPDDMTEQTLSERLDTQGLPDPDLIVRTSGELRLSGILPYQSVYSEFAFLEKHFPDMTAEVLREVLEDYSGRERRFGR